MNDNNYLNYFSFLKNLKNTPDTGMSPLAEWHLVTRFFIGVFSYLDIEWDVNVDRLLDFTGCGVDDYSMIYRHRQNITDIIVSEFRKHNNINNTAHRIIVYLRANNLKKE